MKFDYKGNKQKSTKIQSFIAFIDEVSDLQKWSYMGLEVEIDPIIDFNDENILIRWTSIDEGFNDKIIVYSLLEFQSLFKPINLC
jgi:hypothetical protein